MTEASIEIDKFDANLRNVDLPLGLTIDLIEISGAELSVSGSPFRATSVTDAEIVITVSESSIESFLEKKVPMGMRDFKVQIGAGVLQIDALKTVLVDLKVHVVCSLRIDSESRVFVDLVSVDVMGAGIKQFVQNHLDKLNPILNTDDLPVPAKLSRIVAEDGMLVISGKISPQVS